MNQLRIYTYITYINFIENKYNINTENIKIKNYFIDSLANEAHSLVTMEQS